MPLVKKMNLTLLKAFGGLKIPLRVCTSVTTNMLVQEEVSRSAAKILAMRVLYVIRASITQQPSFLEKVITNVLFALHLELMLEISSLAT